MRLFFAVWPPAEVRERLWRSLAPLRDGMPGVRWVAPERCHITLRFMGDVSMDQLPRLVRAAAALEGETPFRAELAGTGAFPRRGPPRVYWVGVRSDPLLRIHELLNGALAREGFRREERTFAPHLTVGRTKRGGAGWSERGRDRDWSDLGHGIGTHSFRVEAVHLVRGDLSPGGHRYTNVHKVVFFGRGG